MPSEEISNYNDPTIMPPTLSLLSSKPTSHKGTIKFSLLLYGSNQVYLAVVHGANNVPRTVGLNQKTPHNLHVPQPPLDF